jgi:hypothetical protein
MSQHTHIYSHTSRIGRILHISGKDITCHGTTKKVEDEMGLKEKTSFMVCSLCDVRKKSRFFPSLQSSVKQKSALVVRRIFISLQNTNFSWYILLYIGTY